MKYNVKKLCKSRIAIFLLVLFITVIITTLYNYFDRKKFYEDRFAQYHDACSEIALVIYEDSLIHRSTNVDVVSYVIHDDRIIRQGETAETLILSEKHLELLPVARSGLRGYQEYVDACDGMVMFWDSYGNRMIYSVDGSKPQIKETVEEYFKSSFTKLYDNWYRYCLVET